MAGKPGRPSKKTPEVCAEICERLAEGRPSGFSEIYALKHPVTGEIRYVGKANNAEKRLESHGRDSRTRKSPLYDWMGKLALEGLKPCVEVLCVSWDWKTTERQVIAQYRGEGAKLLNLADGGDEPFCSDETRRENGRALCEKLKSSSLLRNTRRLKQMIARGIVDEETKCRLRSLAVEKPEIFGSFAGI